MAAGARSGRAAKTSEDGSFKSSPPDGCASTISGDKIPNDGGELSSIGGEFSITWGELSGVGGDNSGLGGENSGVGGAPPAAELCRPALE